MSVGLAIARGGAFLMAGLVVCALLWNILPKIDTDHRTPEAMTYENRPPPRPPLVVNSQPVVNRQVATTSSDTKLHRRAQCMPLLERINPNIVKPYSYLKFDRAMRNVKRVLDVCPRPFANTKRLVFVGIGSNAYVYSAITGGSTKSFQGWYPRGNEFIVHNFEPLIQFAEGYKNCKMCTFHNAVLGVGAGFLSFRTRSAGAFGQADSYNAQYHATKESGPSDAKFTVPQHDIATWFKENLSRENDFVVLKMDIEGAEWGILPYMAEKNLWEYVDEFFFECHHSKMSERYSTKTYKDCQRVLEDLRSNSSVASHVWDV